MDEHGIILNLENYFDTLLGDTNKSGNKNNVSNGPNHKKGKQHGTNEDKLANKTKRRKSVMITKEKITVSEKSFNDITLLPSTSKLMKLAQISPHLSKIDDQSDAENDIRQQVLQKKAHKKQSKTLVANSSLGSLEEENMTKTLSLVSNESKITDDGFKIVSYVPDDDSDISDAFESDSEAEDSIENGFRIKSEISSDDISDAFFYDEEEDLDQELDLQCDDQEKKCETKQMMKNKYSRQLMRLIEEFGLEKNTLQQKLQVKNSVPAAKRKKKSQHPLPGDNLTKAAQRRGQTKVSVLDYTEKRGTAKRRKNDNLEFVVMDQNSSYKGEEAKMEALMKKARFEVFKFGMTGFDKVKRQDTRIALAVRLGAKPPKNKGTNYKELVQVRKLLKEKEAEDRKVQQQLGLQVTHKSLKPKKRDANKVAGFDSRFGSGGVKVLSKHMVKQMKNVKEK